MKHRNLQKNERNEQDMANGVKTRNKEWDKNGAQGEVDCM